MRLNFLFFFFFFFNISVGHCLSVESHTLNRARIIFFSSSFCSIRKKKTPEISNSTHNECSSTTTHRLKQNAHLMEFFFSFVLLIKWSVNTLRKLTKTKKMCFNDEMYLLHLVMFTKEYFAYRTSCMCVHLSQ